MTEADLYIFLTGVGLVDEPACFSKLTGGFHNAVWLIEIGDQQLVAKCFSETMMGTLFPNLPVDEAEALRRLEGLDVAPRLVGFWPEVSLLVYEYVEGSMWNSDMVGVAELLLRKEVADPNGFRTVPLTSEDILIEGDLLFARCASEAVEFRPKPIAIPKLEKLSLIHTDVGVNLVGAGSGLRLIDWQCPATGDICEDIYSFLSPAFQILGGRPPLTDAQISIFWNALDRPDLAHRYEQLRASFAWRFSGYCAWQAQIVEDPNICRKYRRALTVEFAYMKDAP
jgi:thiamine kinase